MNKTDSKLTPIASTKATPKLNKGMHPRNLHNAGYDFEALISSFNELKPFVSRNDFGNLSIDFASPKAVKALNAALLKHHYGVDDWDIPEGFLCPPIPGRADYIHHIADLLAVKKSSKNKIPKGDKITVLDIGTGANVIYPLLGVQSYGWQFVGSDVDPASLENAQQIFAKNPGISGKFSCRLQGNTQHVFNGIINKDDRFDVTLCNPPFHASLAEASAGTARKLTNLAANRAAKSGSKATKKTTNIETAVLNFGGQKAELWCEGGERQFLSNMISESRSYASQCFWFTSLISKKENLKPAQALLQKVNAHQVKVIEMHQGSKITRILAWTFLTQEQQQLWLQYRELF